jgi:hypothetical protein
MKLRRLMLTLLLPVVLLSIGFLDLVARDPRVEQQVKNLTFAGGSGGPRQPIAGEAVTLPEAQTRVDFPIPVLPAAALADACNDQGPAPLTLLQVWVSSFAEGEEYAPQVGMNYSHGIWVSLSPLSSHTFGDVEELPAVEDFFDPGWSYPDGLITGVVRDHVAWKAPISPDFDCGSGSQVPGVPLGEVTPLPVPEVEAPPVGAVMYDPLQTGSIKWLENGVVINLVGPYPTDILSAIVEGEVIWTH